MLVSTTVMSTRRRRAADDVPLAPQGHQAGEYVLEHGFVPAAVPDGSAFFASGTRSPSIRQNARWSKLPRTSRSHSSKLQSERCLVVTCRKPTVKAAEERGVCAEA